MALELGPLLRQIRTLRDLPRLVAALGHEPLWEPVPAEGWLDRPVPGVPGPVVAAGRAGAFPWLALAAGQPARAARALARRLARSGRPAGVLGLDGRTRRLAVAVACDRSPVLELDLRDPAPEGVASLARLAGPPTGGALAYAARAVEALGAESVGRRFFREFRSTLDRMAAALPGRLSGDDRHAFALLQLTRVLFLYFIQSKGWLAGRDRFLAEEVDRCLARRRGIQRDLLRPLFFGTLNRPAAERGRGAAALGGLPFLNGGLFEPHPLERRVRADLPNPLWRDAFDGLFERFHFAVAERDGRGVVAPDMLGRVFEGVMDPVERRASGTFYTPAALVSELLDAGLAAVVSARLGCGDGEAERRLGGNDPAALAVLRDLTLLDPAVGSGAFLLGALERLSALASGGGGAGGGPAGTGSDRKRRILQRNLFGVDRSATAVRLTELRLWLAVIAADPAERPERVAPLPNLDCLVRQGDSLFDPVGLGIGGRPAAALGRELASLRGRVVAAAGGGKPALVRALRTAEARAFAAALEEAEGRARAEVARCLEEARGRDLFGERRGLDRSLRERLGALRGRLAELGRARRLHRAGELPWFHYQSHFADVFVRGGFDLVIGNPPWLRAEQIPPELRARLAARYRWWRGASGGYGNRPDLALAFLERALELAAPGGGVAFLVPAKLASAGYGAVARHALAATTTLHAVADLTGHESAAFEATVYPLALVIRNEAPPAGARLRAALAPGAPARVRQDHLTGGGPWVLAGDPVRRALARLARDHPAFGESFVCHLGVKTGANAVFLDPPDDLEPELIRRAVRGRDVGPFLVRNGPRLLWTHGETGRPLASLPPRAAAYLAPHTAKLRQRADHLREPAWAVFRAGPATGRHRVVWADLARRLAAVALTGAADQDRIPLNSCYLALAPSANEARRVAAWLNATWVRAAARLCAPPASGGFARFNGTVVSRLPLPGSVLADARLLRLAVAGGHGEPVQEELDQLAAEHLGLTRADRTALRATVEPGARHRR